MAVAAGAGPASAVTAVAGLRQTVIRGDILSIVSSGARGARPGLCLCAGKNVRSWAEWQSLLSLHLEPQLSAMHLSQS